MNGPELMLYGTDALNPGNIDKYSEYVKLAGWTTINVSFIHVSYENKDGDPGNALYFNNDKITIAGQFLPHFGDWNKSLLALKQNSPVKKLYLSVGGGGVRDFKTLSEIYADNHNSFEGTLVAKNFLALKKALTAIDAIDLDCEDHYDIPSFVAFAQLMSSIGWELSAAPFDEGELSSFWVPSLQQLKGSVKRINLQSGAPNPKDWVDQFSKNGIDVSNNFLLGDLAKVWVVPEDKNDPPYWLGDCPPQVTDAFKQRKQGIESSVAGGFIYSMDWIVAPPYPPPSAPCELEHFPTMLEYAEAILAGMGMPVPVK